MKTLSSSKRLVVLESPYAGNIVENVRYARAAIRDCISRMEAPIASHLLYTQDGILDDKDNSQRVTGIECGLNWAARADAMVVYCDLGISPGMLEAIEYATHLRVPVEYRKLDT